ncbi:MAG: hypothetical protein JSS10_03450 [Verrucomicrobia bacterium]|nr:hypothetical protein [Verrucomicrobiota bacterium]
MSIRGPNQPSFNGFSQLPTYLLSAWREQPTAIKGLTVLTGGAALAFAIRYFGSLTRPSPPREIEGRNLLINPPFVIVHPNKVSDKPFRSLQGNCMNEQILPKIDGGYVQGIIHFEPINITEGSREPLAVEYYHKGEVLQIWTILVTELPQGIFIPNLPNNDQILIKFSWPGCQQPKEITINIDQIRGLYSIDDRSMQCASTPLEEKVFSSPANGRPTANILPIGGKKFDDCVIYRLTTDGIQVSNGIPPNYQWRFINTTRTYQVCILKLQAKKYEEDKAEIVAAPIVLRPNETIDFTRESLKKFAKGVVFEDTRDLISLLEIQQIVYYPI